MVKNNKQPVPTMEMSASSLLKPTNAKTERKVWSIGLNTLTEFFKATNTTGETAIPADVLGAPLRLARNKDKTPKFKDDGVTPVIRVAKELSDQVKIMRENFAFGLLAYAQQVAEAMPDQFKAQVEAAAKAGGEVIAKEAQELKDYVDSHKPADDTTKNLVNEAQSLTGTNQPREMVPA